MANFPSARIIANSTDKRFETVNINSSAVLPDVAKRGKFKRYTQVTAAVAAANKGKFETLKDSGGTVAGLRTIHIPGYAAPN